MLVFILFQFQFFIEYQLLSQVEVIINKFNRVLQMVTSINI